MRRHGIVVRPTGTLGATFNPAAVRHEDGRFIMLVRSVPSGYRKLGAVNQFDDLYTSHLSLWEGRSPTEFKLIDPFALTPGEDFDRFGVEDPRVSKIADTYYICYTALSKGLGQPDAASGIRIAMASTKDFKSFRKHGLIGPDRRCKAGTIFESAGKRYFMWKDEEKTERTMLSPVPENLENTEAWKTMWTSRDIERDLLLGPQANGYENMGIEPGAPPIEIEEGLLTVYSSIFLPTPDSFTAEPEWNISLMLLDKRDPSRIIAKTDAPFLRPEQEYERKGDVNNVVFPCGALINREQLYVYYGGADTVCAVGSESMAQVRKSLKPFATGPDRAFSPG